MSSLLILKFNYSPGMDVVVVAGLTVVVGGGVVGQAAALHLWVSRPEP